MKKTEVIKLLKFLNNYYQRKFEYPKEDKTNTKMMTETWYEFLKEYDYKFVSISVKKLIIHKEWPPTPGELILAIEKLKRPEKISAGEAWKMVIHAIKEHSYFYNSKKVRSVLPKDVLKAADICGLELIAKEGGDSYVMSTFIKIYNSLQEKKIKNELLPKSVSKEVNQLTQSYMN